MAKKKVKVIKIKIDDPIPPPTTRTFPKPTREQLETLGACDLNLDEIALYLGMSSSTLDRFLKDDPRLRDAIDAGRTKAISTVMGSLYREAQNGQNMKATELYLKAMGKLKPTTINLTQNTLNVSDKKEVVDKTLREVLKLPDPEKQYLEAHETNDQED